MGSPITTELVVFFLTLLGVVAGLWWRIEARIESARTAAAIVAADFARYQTHVAETYITKQGLRETTGQVMDAIADLKLTLDHVNTRIDTAFAPSTRPPRARQQRSGG